MQSKEINTIIISCTVIILLIAFGFLIMFILFYKSRKKLLIEKQEAKIKYLQEISNTKSEIQNETLNHIGRELHDNVGQLLAVAKIHTNGLIRSNPSDKLSEINSALSQSIDEVRTISHSLNADRINSFGLITALKTELERIKKLQTIIVHDELNLDGLFEIESDKEIMLYRIVQEFISNTLKYAQAKNLTIALAYDSNKLIISLSEDGIGFDKTLIEQGTGLSNMKHRADLINASFDYETAPKKGTKLTLHLPKNITDV